MFVCPVLYYHLISPPPPGQPKAAIYLPPERFDAQMRFLKRLNYRALTVDEFADRFDRQQNPAGRSVLITFDDGHRDNHANALPILKKHGFPATVFVTAGAIGGRLRLRASVDPEGEPMLDEAQIREMTAQGMDIQSHGMTHASLPDLDDDRAFWEMTESKRILEELVGRPVRYFCFPFGNFKLRHLKMAEAAGYRMAFSAVQGKRHYEHERYCIKRIPVHYGRSLARFFTILHLKSFSRSERKLRARLEID